MRRTHVLHYWCELRVCVFLRQDQRASTMNSRKMLVISRAKEERILIMPAEHDRRFFIIFVRIVLLIFSI